MIGCTNVKFNKMNATIKFPVVSLLYTHIFMIDSVTQAYIYRLLQLPLINQIIKSNLFVIFGTKLLY